MKQKAKKLLSGLLALALVLGLAPAVTPRRGRRTRSNLDEKGVERSCTTYTVINGGTTAWTKNVTDGWYVLNSTDTVESPTASR